MTLREGSTTPRSRMQAGSGSRENLPPCGHISLGHVRYRGLLLHSTARFSPLDPDRWTRRPAGQLVKGTRAPQHYSQSATGSSGTIANRREDGPAPPPTCSPLAPHPTVLSPHLGPSITCYYWGSGCSRESQFPSPGTALAFCPAMQERDEGSWGHREAQTLDSQTWDEQPLGTREGEGARACRIAG